MQEPQVFDRFPVSVSLGLGDMCLVEYAVKKELACCRAAATAGDEHAVLRCKWYEDILAAVQQARAAGEEEYNQAWDDYMDAWNGN